MVYALCIVLKLTAVVMVSLFSEDPVQNIIAQMEAPCKTSKTNGMLLNKINDQCLQKLDFYPTLVFTMSLWLIKIV